MYKTLKSNHYSKEMKKAVKCIKNDSICQCSSYCDVVSNFECSFILLFAIYELRILYFNLILLITMLFYINNRVAWITSQVTSALQPLAMLKTAEIGIKVTWQLTISFSKLLQRVEVSKHPCKWKRFACFKFIWCI